MKKVLLVMFTLFSFYSSKAALNAGDIAFVQYNADADNYAFVALVDIPAGEEIKFTDNGWMSSGSFRSGENTETWTAPSVISQGTVITLSGLTGLSADGDQILAYQGSSSSPTFIAAINNNGGSGTWDSNAADSHTSALPAGLTDGVNAVSLTEIDNAAYDASVLTGTAAQIRAAINDDSNWSGSNTVEQTFAGMFVLPVELTSFTARPSNTTVELNWATASELNNAHFNVETSTDGRNFTTIEKVEGFGTTNEAQYYDFTHKTPANGLNYYRLKQVDFDGAFEYSPIVTATVKKEGTVVINPSAATSQINVEVLTDVENATIAIFDMMGRQVLQTNYDGALSFKTIDVTDLDKGHYVVRVQAGNEVFTKRFVKMTE